MSRWDSTTQWFDLIERVVDARMSRRRALRTGVVAAGALVGVSLAEAVPALAWSGSQPRPIPGGFSDSFEPVPVNPLLPFLPPPYRFQISTITAFPGLV